MQINEFKDRDDFIDALLASCHIPIYLNGKWTTTFRDGCVHAHQLAR